jgi:hypothetical protein
VDLRLGSPGRLDELYNGSVGTLLDRFSAEEGAFKRLQKVCESKVVRWKYWETPDWHWDPEKFIGSTSAKAAKGEAAYAYGYDKENRVTVIHGFDTDRKKLSSTDFLRYAGDKIVGTHFIEVSHERPSDVFDATFVEGRITRLECLYGTVEWEWKAFEWEGDRIAAVLYGASRRKPHVKIIYDASGEEIETIDPSKPTKRKPLPKGTTMKSLAKTIRQRLGKAVIDTVAKARIKQPVYCIALNYDCEGNPLLLPELGIGLESERQAVLKRGGKGAKLDIWDPSTFSMFANNRTALNDKALARACDLFNEQLKYEDSDEPARKIILEVALDLAKVDWKKKLDITEDFIVYAVDTDGADLKKNLKRSVSAKQIARLKAAKLL